MKINFFILNVLLNLIVAPVLTFMFLRLAMVFEATVIFFLCSSYGLLWFILDEISLLNRVTNQPKDLNR